MFTESEIETLNYLLVQDKELVDNRVKVAKEYKHAKEAEEFQTILNDIDSILNKINRIDLKK